MVSVLLLPGNNVSGIVVQFVVLGNRLLVAASKSGCEKTKWFRETNLHDL